MIELKVFAMQLACGEQPIQHAVIRITLDLDDGVKVNYGKFGDLLEGVKAATGRAVDECDLFI